MRTPVTSTVAALLLAACSAHVPQPLEPSPGHLRPAPEAPAAAEEIPAPVVSSPILPEPEAAASLETYTVVVSQVPVKELLFALARDARLNVDIHQDISGEVTLNAVDQTLPQILERLARQVDLRYEIEANQLTVLPDEPYLKTYRVDYLNLSRESTSSVSLSTKVASTGTQGDQGGGSGSGGGSGGSDSSTNVTNESKNDFWTTLVANVREIVGRRGGEGGESVIANPSAGVLTVRATGKEHGTLQEYLDRVLANATRQVLIEATIAEVELNDEYQGGVDWAKVAVNQGLSILSGTASRATGAAAVATSSAINLGNSNGNPFFILDFQSNDDRARGLSLTVNLLSEFGNVSVLSSPKIMTLNNQAAVLKVVDNLVYFTIEREVTGGLVDAQGQIVQQLTSETSTVNTVPVGIVMQVIPQISDARNVILNVRPTISRRIGEVEDPVNQGSFIPQISVRELESVLRVQSGQIAVLGGLMQDEDSRTSAGVPGASTVDGIGDLFRNRNDRVSKSELVIFLRPVVIDEPSLDRDLREFRPFLERAMARRNVDERRSEQP